MTNIQTSLGRMLNTYGDSTVGSNSMQVDLDMNSSRAINASDGIANSDYTTLRQLQSLITSSSVQDVTNASVVTSVTNLKALDVSSLDNLHLGMTKGYVSAGDGGHSTYYYDSASSATDDGGSVIAPDAGTGRWLLITSGTVNVKQFGAIADNSTDDTSAIQAAIDYAQNSTAGRAVYFPPGEYKITESLVVTAACTLYSDSKPGPQNYPITHQGGARINFDPASTITAAITDPSSFALQIDIGTIGAEGFGNTHVHHLGFGSPDKRGGCIYVEASVNVDIEYCWFHNNQDNYDDTTIEAIAVYCRDMIVSTIRRNTFKNVGWGIVADDYCNENHFVENDFERAKLGMIAIYGVSTFSVRNSIRDNNFIGDANYPDTAILLGGLVRMVSIYGNTFESIRKNNITVSDVNPLTAASIGSGPIGTTINDNFFVAAGGGQVNSRCINFGISTGSVVMGNTITNPTVNLQALIGTAAATVSKVYAIANNVDTVALSAGDPTKVIEDTYEYRGNAIISGGPSTSGWTNDEAARVWWDPNTSGALQRSLRVWNGTRSSGLKQCGTRTDTTQDATPEVRGLSSLLCNAATYTITALDEGAAGQSVIIYNQHAGNLNIDCTGTNLISQSGSDLAIVQNAWVKFESLNGTTWVEV